MILVTLDFITQKLWAYKGCAPSHESVPKFLFPCGDSIRRASLQRPSKPLQVHNRVLLTRCWMILTWISVTIDAIHRRKSQRGTDRKHLIGLQKRQKYCTVYYCSLSLPVHLNFYGCVQQNVQSTAQNRYFCFEWRLLQIYSSCLKLIQRLEVTWFTMWNLLLMSNLETQLCTVLTMHGSTRLSFSALWLKRCTTVSRTIDHMGAGIYHKGHCEMRNQLQKCRF